MFAINIHFIVRDDIVDDDNNDDDNDNKIDMKHHYHHPTVLQNWGWWNIDHHVSLFVRLSSSTRSWEPRRYRGTLVLWYFGTLCGGPPLPSSKQLPCQDSPGCCMSTKQIAFSTIARQQTQRGQPAAIH